MNWSKIASLVLLLSMSVFMSAQTVKYGKDVDTKLGKADKHNQWVEKEVIDGDTLIIQNLPTIAFTSKRFETKKEEYAYNKLRRNIIKVYPYAKKASELYWTVRAEREQIGKRRKEKRYINELEKKFKKEFKAPLKNLTVSQGKVLIKFIERDTGKTFNEVLREFKSGIAVTFYRGIGKAYGYNFKQGYTPTDNEDFEEIVSALEAEEQNKTASGTEQCEESKD